MTLPFSPVPKPKHHRRTPKRRERSRFSDRTIKEIFERDNYQCVKCGSYRNLEAIPHHIIFRSQGGTGDKRNGATVCRDCHRQAHTYDDDRRWFECWRDRTLDEYGNYQDDN